MAPSTDEVGPELARKQFRDMPDVNIMRHAGRLLVLAEGEARSAAVSAAHALVVVAPGKITSRLQEMRLSRTFIRSSSIHYFRNILLY